MKQEYAQFQYRSFPDIPKEYRQVDWTYINVSDKPFSEGEEAFHRLKEDSRELYADKPFAYLEFLRGVESRMLMLAVIKRQPVSRCLEILRRRLDLEYDRGEVHSKADQAVITTDYFVRCGEIELAKAILKEEKQQLQETAEACRVLLENVARRIDELDGKSGQELKLDRS
jgi:hypothetical protein